MLVLANILRAWASEHSQIHSYPDDDMTKLMINNKTDPCNWRQFVKILHIMEARLRSSMASGSIGSVSSPARGHMFLGKALNS